MNSLRECFRAAKVLVIGDVMLDEYIAGSVARISPEAPVPVLDVRSRYAAAGGAANVAMNVAALGATVSLIGLAGSDPAGASLRTLLCAAHIDDCFLIDAADRGTISKTRIVAGQQQICRIDREVRTDISGALAAQIVDSAAKAIGDADIVVLSDYAKGILTDDCAHALMALARTHGKRVIVDPKARDFRKYAGCTLITPNQAEAAAASGIAIDSDESLHRAGRVLMDQLPGAAVLITRGPDGMALFQPGAPERANIQSTAHRVFDVVGAGDTVVATLAVALAAGLPLHESTVWSNIAAGLVVGKPGTAAIAFEELEGAARQHASG